MFNSISQKIVLSALLLLSNGLLAEQGLNSSKGTGNPQEIQPVKIYGKDHFLINIKDVVIKGDTVISITGDFPSIHIFSEKYYTSWGKEGNGPGELNITESVEVRNESIYILDFRTGSCKVIRYDLTGQYISSIPVRGYLCHDFNLGGDQQLIEVGSFGDQKKNIMDLGRPLRKVASFKEPDPVRIRTPEGPMQHYNVENPFIAKPIWHLNSKGKLIMWNGESNDLTIKNLKTKQETSVSMPPVSNIVIKPAAVKLWIDDKFPANKVVFGRERFFRSVRKRAGDKVPIPDYYAPLYDIKTDPWGNIWVQRTRYRKAGQVWTYLPLAEERNLTFELPEGRKLAAVGKEYVAATMMDEDGIEYIELYKREELLRNSIGDV